MASRAPADPALLGRVRQARRQLPALVADRVRSPGDFERVSLPAADADVLRDVLFAERARAVIEIGLAYGASALAIAEALVAQGTDGARHLIVDAFQDRFNDAGRHVLATAGLTTMVSLLRERSQLALPRLVTDGFTADTAFVDGSHHFHNVFVDLVFLQELVRPGGLIVLDDADLPPVATAARYFERNTGWEPVPLGRPTRLRAYRLPAVRVERGFEDFRPFGLDESDAPD